ncbi:hypothetical protein KC327_g7438 [Hortaea werneckii]|nr:hypothetical protein KC358_g14426 [Hortaea werneckii]KAI6819683.1 hypothetical protein KC350_g10009 [Hortaea werneckii]KAI6907072.1 hypothetical protein KC348_g14382 [Hortaea werneckii]KAI6924293.1 hypothetical protein KC341_g14151 [Hortaea werneckii]KAI6957884.1 hypothetical protein KC321_g14331 [Hortaea werneckii]
MSSSTASHASPPAPVFYNDIPYDSDDEDDTWKYAPTGKQQNGHNDWRKNTKIKTAKCAICGYRVSDWSWVCSKFSCHVCSDCIEKDPSTRGEGGLRGALYWYQYNYLARDWLKVVCGCRYSTRQAPYIKEKFMQHRWECLPPIKNDELEAGKEQKRKQAEKKRLQEEHLSEDEDDSMPDDSNETGAYHIPDHEFEGFSSAQPTISGSRQKRAQPIAPTYQEPETPEEADIESSSASTSSIDLNPRPSNILPDPFVDTMKPPTTASYSHLRGGSTIIVGAGIVGLNIARELAIQTEQAGIRHAITVIDIQEDVCCLASANCAGLLSIHGRPDSLQSLCDLSLEAWGDLSDIPGFSESTKLRLDSVYTVARSDGKNRDAKPSWYTGHGLESFEQDSTSIGKLDTDSLIDHLLVDCRARGVSFIFNRSIDTATMKSGKLSAITITDPHRKGRNATIQCQNLILAAGAYTSGIVQYLFPQNSLQLENHVRDAHWYHTLVPDMTKEDDIGLLFPTLAESDRLLDDKMIMVSSQEDEIISIIGQDRESKNISLSPADAMADHSGDRNALRHLKRLIAERLRPVDGDRRYTKGSSLISSSNNGLPVLDAVPTSLLFNTAESETCKQESGLWLCFGFGMYGTTLAPGAARAICRRMFGEPSGMDDGKLNLSTNSVDGDGVKSVDDMIVDL